MRWVMAVSRGPSTTANLENAKAVTNQLLHGSLCSHFLFIGGTFNYYLNQQIFV